MTTRLIALAVSQAFIETMKREGKLTVKNKSHQSKYKSYWHPMRAAERRIERACREDFWRERECKQFEVRQEPQREIARSSRRGIVNI